jgi:hypothetical protein
MPGRGISALGSENKATRPPVAQGSKGDAHVSPAAQNRDAPASANGLCENMRLLSECHESGFGLETLCLLIGHSAKYRPRMLPSRRPSRTPSCDAHWALRSLARR